MPVRGYLISPKPPPFPGKPPGPEAPPEERGQEVGYTYVPWGVCGTVPGGWGVKGWEGERGGREGSGSEREEGGPGGQNQQIGKPTLS